MVSFSIVFQRVSPVFLNSFFNIQIYEHGFKSVGVELGKLCQVSDRTVSIVYYSLITDLDEVLLSKIYLKLEPNLILTISQVFSNMNIVE